MSQDAAGHEKEWRHGGEAFVKTMDRSCRMKVSRVAAMTLK